MRTVTFIIILFSTFSNFSQDIKCAYITSAGSGLTYTIRVTLITPATTINVRPTINVNFGDASTGTLNQVGASNSNGINTLFYSGSHTYNNSGLYDVSYIDTFRIGGIKNMTSSSTQSIGIRTQIYSNNISGLKSYPLLSNLPTNFEVNGNMVSYNPHCLDANSDSLSYSLTNCIGSNYYIPCNAVINPTSGIVSFSKDSIGLYAFSFDIYKWRKNQANLWAVIGISQMDFTMDINSTIGIYQETFTKPFINIYPNPASNEIHLKLDNISLSEQMEVRFNDLSGRLLFKQKTKVSDESIDISNLANGIYFAEILQNDNVIYRQKLIKQ